MLKYTLTKRFTSNSRINRLFSRNQSFILNHLWLVLHHKTTSTSIGGTAAIVNNRHWIKDKDQVLLHQHKSSLKVFHWEIQDNLYRHSSMTMINSSSHMITEDKTFTQLKITTLHWFRIIRSIRIKSKEITSSRCTTKMRDTHIDSSTINSWRIQLLLHLDVVRQYTVADLETKEESNQSFKVLVHQSCRLALSSQMTTTLTEIQTLEQKRWCKKPISSICSNSRMKEQKLIVREPSHKNVIEK